MRTWQQLKAILWLRWTISVHQWKRGGKLNAVLGAIFYALMLVLAVSSFFISLLVGWFLLPDLDPDAMLILWDVLIGAFLFFWGMGIVTELQRSEPLSLEKLLHLPVSPSGAYLLNYLGSWFSLALVIFLPTAAGLSLAIVIRQGPRMLVLFPLVASFLIMVTAFAHQFRGWLQVLMANKRRRRTIITLITLAIILACQIPNLVNIALQRQRHGGAAPSEFEVAVDQLEQRMQRGEVSSQQYQEELEALTQQRDEKTERQQRERYQQVIRILTVVNSVIPVGWLPMGARAASAGQLWPGGLALLGSLLLGAGSLWRSYRTTLRFYRGGFNGQRRKAAPPRDAVKSANFLERRWRWLPEQAMVVSLGAFRSLMRGPEGKMLLLSPILLTGFFAFTIFWRQSQPVPEQARPLLGLGAVSMILLCFIHPLCNQFGFDRGGFRTLLLSPCPRRYILLGKNLALAPLVLGVGIAILTVVQYFSQVGIEYWVAHAIQLVCGYLFVCVIGNSVSVLAPSALIHGMLKPAKSRVKTILVQTAAALLSPVSVMPAAILVGLESLLRCFGLALHVPIYLIGSIIELALAASLYYYLLPVLGRLMERREPAILDAVAARTE